MTQDYLSNLKSLGYSPVTITGAKEVLGRFSSWLWNVRDKKLKDALEEDMEKYVLHLKENLSPGTQRLYFSHVRRVYRFLHRQEKILLDPTRRILPLKKEKLFRSQVPDSQSLTVLLEAPDEHTYHGIRDRAILELLYSSGLRNKEIRSLKLTEVDLKERLVRIIQGKGGRGRSVPLGEKAALFIQRYLEVTRPKYARSLKEDHLFLSERGNPLPQGAVNEMLHRYRKRSNLTKTLTPHGLRHACALHMLRGGAPIQVIQEILGHRSLSSTQVYTRLYPKDLKTAHQKFHPRETKTPLTNCTFKGTLKTD